MSLTESNDVVAIAHEDGLNDLLAAFFNARRRHRVYGTSVFVPSTTAAATNIPTISFPGIPGGIHFAVAMDVPTVDLHPDTAGGPLPPGPGQFTVSMTVLLAVLCGVRSEDNLTHGKTTAPRSSGEFKFVRLGLHVRGRIINVGSELMFAVDDVEIVDIEPEDLECVMECILKLIAQAVLANVRIPFDALSAGAFTLTLTDGPRIEDDQVKVFGTI